jgi:hypothetical protein
MRFNQNQNHPNHFQRFCSDAKSDQNQNGGTNLNSNPVLAKSSWFSGFVLINYFPGQIKVADRPFAFCIVHDGRHAIAWRFAEFNVSGDNGGKHHILEMLPYFFHNLI